MPDQFSHLEPLEQAFDSSETRDPHRLIQNLRYENETALFCLKELRQENDRLRQENETLRAQLSGKPERQQYGWHLPTTDNEREFAKKYKMKLESAHSTDGIISDKVCWPQPSTVIPSQKHTQHPRAIHP